MIRWRWRRLGTTRTRMDAGAASFAGIQRLGNEIDGKISAYIRNQLIEVLLQMGLLLGPVMPLGQQVPLVENTMDNAIWMAKPHIF